jgi:hypothetical protein
MENQYQEVIQSSIDELGANDLDLNSLSNLISIDSITAGNLRNLRLQLDRVFEKINAELDESKNRIQSTEFIDSLKCDLMELQYGIDEACHKYEEHEAKSYDGDRLLTKILARNHRVFFELVKIRDA